MQPIIFMKRPVIRLLPLIIAALLAVGLTGCGSKGESAGSQGAGNKTAATRTVAASLNNDAMSNPAAYIPPQCYTRTQDERGVRKGRSANPCYACHNVGRAPNYVNDSDLQTVYAMPAFAQKNHWANLFVDRREQIAAISDRQILEYIRRNNYQDKDGAITLARVLAGKLPAGWDADGDGRWSGYVPDVWFRFDDEGFDRAPNGDYSGWRAFAYTPFLGTFWPTNGSTDDVLIRLAPALRQDADGHFDLTTYKVNLAIVQAVIQRRDVAIDPVDERRFGVDLDRNGRLDTAGRVVFRWVPIKGQDMQYVGLAKRQQAAGKLHLAGGLYPEGTEFLHTVRYLDPVGGEAGIGLSARIKEVRYAVKRGWNNYAQLNSAANGERLEDMRFPDRLRRFVGNIETGLQNGLGWYYAGFIEDRDGDLRPQSKEELYACMGCHSALGVTTDSSFAFPRKLGGDQAHGWYHWTQRTRGLNGLPEPRRADGVYEYTRYLERNHAGDEFRENREVMARFFTTDGGLQSKAVDALHGDIGSLLLPSPARALALDKAYYLIVREQSFTRGRDALLEPPANIHDFVGDEEPTGVATPELLRH